MANTITLSARDFSVLQFLSWTPATAALLLRASPSFAGDLFTDERRIRERLQTLKIAGLARSWPSAHAGGGLQNYYKLTLPGYERFYGPSTEKPPKAFFLEISPTLFDHTLTLAEVIVEMVRACHIGRVKIVRVFRENELTFTAGRYQVQPDCFFRLQFGGKPFNVAFEIDQGTESLDSNADNSIRTKLRTYDEYQETLLSDWRIGGKTWERPRFRVAFLAPSIDRVHHILSLAGQLASNQKRRLVLAATQDSIFGESDPLRSPIFLDHLGYLQSLVNLHPGRSLIQQPVRLRRHMVDKPTMW